MCAESVFAPGIEQADWIDIGLLDIAVTPLTAREAATVAVSPQGKRLLLNHNLHSSYIHDIDAPFRQLYRSADWVIVDGAPVLWLASMSAKRRLAAAYRITSTDWMDALPSLNVSRRLFVFGAKPESNKRAIDKLRTSLPTWVISGVDGYVDDGDAVALINEFRPDLVIVGLGMPCQERFLLTNLPKLPDATYATVGGAIDYLAGTTHLAPRWVGRIGLEWAWRLVYEPRRLGYRYLVEPLYLLRRAALRAIRERGLSRKFRPVRPSERRP